MFLQQDLKRLVRNLVTLMHMQGMSGHNSKGSIPEAEEKRELEALSLQQEQGEGWVS